MKIHVQYWCNCKRSLVSLAVVGGALVGRSDSLGYSTEQELDDLISSDVERFVGEIPSDGE